MKISADMGPFMEAIGVVEGITAAVSTDIYINHVTSHVADKMKFKFEADFMAAARANPRAFHHVFEWGSLGYNGILQDTGLETPVPLFALTKKGRGRFKEVGFRFKQSRILVPLPDAQRSGISQENIDMLKKRAVFRFKAYVMESGMTVHVAPKPGTRRLFVPNATAPEGFVFSRGYNVQPGKGNAGNFTGFWATWWGGTGPAYMQEDIVPNIERQIKVAADKGLRTIRRGKAIKAKELGITNMTVMNGMAAEKAKMVENQLIRMAKEMDAADREDWDEEE